MPSTSGRAYALTILAPIKNDNVGEISCADETRRRLDLLPLHEDSPFAKVPNTYLARLFVLDDVYYESKPASDWLFNFSDLLSIPFDYFRIAALPRHDRLRSKYLVMAVELHGDPDAYLRAFWDRWSFADHGTTRGVPYLLEHCVAFQQRVTDADSFLRYMRDCSLDASLYFNGSTDDSLQEQLKSLYLKQELIKFAMAQQGKPAAETQQAFAAFMQRVQPENLAAPAWPPGLSRL